MLLCYALLLLFAAIVTTIVCWPLLRRQAYTRQGQSNTWVVDSQLNSRWFWLLVIAVPVIAVLLYMHFGGLSQQIIYSHRLSEQRHLGRQLQASKSASAVIDRFSRAVAKQPNDPQGWYLLARLYLSQSDYPHAVSALRRAHALTPNNSIYAVAFFKAAFFMQHGHLTTEQEKQLSELVRQWPSAWAALNLLAIDAYDKQHYHQAVRLWRRLLQHYAMTAGSERRPILAMIAMAQQHFKR